MEILAALLTLVSVFLASHLRTALYPVGLAATAAYAVVFYQAQLYASTALQIWFVIIQLYGWWFWKRGAHGQPPLIGDWGWRTILALGAVAAVLSTTLAAALAELTDAATPFGDTLILSMSVLAQFLLDRKQIKSWAVWAVNNVIAIGVYGHQGLWLTAALYALLLLNTPYGWWRWRSAMKTQQAMI